MPSSKDRLRDLAAFAACLGEQELLRDMWRRRRKAYKQYLKTLREVVAGAGLLADMCNDIVHRAAMFAKLISVPTETLMRDDLSNQSKPMVSWLGE